MALLNELGSTNRMQAQLHQMACPRCQLDMKMEGIYTGADPENERRRRVEGEYFCDCGYSVTIIERYPAFLEEAPHQQFITRQ